MTDDETDAGLAECWMCGALFDPDECEGDWASMEMDTSGEALCDDCRDDL